MSTTILSSSKVDVILTDSSGSSSTTTIRSDVLCTYLTPSWEKNLKTAAIAIRASPNGAKMTSSELACAAASAATQVEQGRFNNIKEASVYVLNNEIDGNGTPVGGLSKELDANTD